VYGTAAYFFLSIKTNSYRCCSVVGMTVALIKTTQAPVSYKRAGIKRDGLMLEANTIGEQS